MSFEKDNKSQLDAIAAFFPQVKVENGLASGPQTIANQVNSNFFGNDEGFKQYQTPPSQIQSQDIRGLGTTGPKQDIIL